VTPFKTVGKGLRLAGSGGGVDRHSADSWRADSHPGQTEADF